MPHQMPAHVGRYTIPFTMCQGAADGMALPTATRGDSGSDTPPLDWAGLPSCESASFKDWFLLPMASYIFWQMSYLVITEARRSRGSHSVCRTRCARRAGRVVVAQRRFRLRHASATMPVASGCQWVMVLRRVALQSPSCMPPINRRHVATSAAGDHGKADQKRQEHPDISSLACAHPACCRWIRPNTVAPPLLPRPLLAAATTGTTTPHVHTQWMPGCSDPCSLERTNCAAAGLRRTARTGSTSRRRSSAASWEY